MVLIGLRFSFFGVLAFIIALAYFFDRIEAKFIARLARNGAFGRVSIN